MKKEEKLDIIYEDKDIIVVNKKSGLLTISNAHEKERTLYYQVSSYVKKQNKNNKIFIVHHLDKDTSGLVVFAKSEKVKKLLQDNWQDTIRIYLGIVNGVVNKNKDTLKSYLKEDKTHYVYSTKNKGDLAITEYEKLISNNKYTLLKIQIYTGKKNQIRVQLNDINYPLVGDKKYSKINNKNMKRLYLHAFYLEFKHPVSKRVVKLVTKYPEEFSKLVPYTKKDLL